MLRRQLRCSGTPFDREVARTPDMGSPPAYWRNAPRVIAPSFLSSVLSRSTAATHPAGPVASEIEADTGDQKTGQSQQCISDLLAPISQQPNHPSAEQR